MKKVELNKKELDNILKMYNEELLGTHTISLKTGISKPTINRILKENGVVFGPSGRRFIGGRKVSLKKYDSKPEVKERKKENHKKWLSENKDKWNEYIKEYREKNIDKIRKIKRDRQKQHGIKLRKRAAIFTRQNTATAKIAPLLMGSSTP